MPISSAGKRLFYTFDRRIRKAGRGSALIVATLGWAGVADAELASRSEDARFGVMTHFAQGWDVGLMPVIAAAGVHQVRDELYWNDVEAEKGVFKFPAGYRVYLEGLAKAGISPLIVLSFENKHYDGGQTPYTEEGFAAYARYAVEVIRHCGPQVKAVEIWNEYNGSFARGPASQDRASTYLKMLRVAYAAIKRERPDITVVAGATAGVPRPYIEKLFAGGALECMDAFSIHPYRYESTPEGIEDEVAAVRRLMKAAGTAKPIWVTEIGWQLKPSKAAGDLLVDEAVQARFLTRAYALLLAGGAERVYWYLFRDHQEFAMGLIDDDEARTVRPAYRALQALIAHLAGARFERREPSAEGLYSLLFRGNDGEERRVVWSLTPETLSGEGAKTVADLEGRTLATSEKVSLSDSPILVTGAWRGLPAAPTTSRRIADARGDFSREVTGAWRYGFFENGSTEFHPLPNYETTDWKAEWTGTHPYISITADHQHPSTSAGQPVASVRRWIAPSAGRYHVTGSFQCGTDGDGVGASIVVDGRPRFRKLLGRATRVREDFDFEIDVVAGATLDFAVDPGPVADINSDVTTVRVAIDQLR